MEVEYFQLVACIMVRFHVGFVETNDNCTTDIRWVLTTQENSS
uniref:Uncharacterized protein n=1 Tax=Arundo donax TaxID=35708 RepID=A0A0A8YS92_ARUDO